MQNETLEIPCIVGGKEIHTGNTLYQVAVRQILTYIIPLYLVGIPHVSGKVRKCKWMLSVVLN